VATDKAWEAISKIGRLDVWFPIIATCKVEGDGVGAHRHMTLEDGGEITDHIEEINPTTKRLTYLRVESPFPVTYYKGTVEVFDSFDSMAVVVWTIDFESDPENSVPVADLVKGG
jgi:polyketide cyclase/dehydrase/lipid transport protein